MKITLIRLALAAPILLIAFSFLGGSAVWAVLGLSDDLNIDGTADIVRTEIGGLGDS